LVESLDNANNLTPLDMWRPLLDLLRRTESEEIRKNVLWILGTAVQNNTKAQDDFLTHDPVPLLLSYLDLAVSKNSETRSKAMYALSSTLKHSKLAVEKLAQHDGWNVLQRALTDTAIAVRRKTAFLIASLLIPVEAISTGQAFPNDKPFDADAISTAASTKGELESDRRNPSLLDSIISGLVNSEDVTLQETLAKCLVNFADVEGKFSAPQKEVLDPYLARHEEDTLGLDDREWKLLARVLKHR